MSSQEFVLGIDTSNYTSSVALCDQEGEITLDRRIPLVVKQGERGLRQSNALFQHLENLPGLLSLALSEHRHTIKAVCVSEKPRPVEDSYMPVFKAGVQFGETVAAALGVPLFKSTHQEGHLRAGAHHTGLDRKAPYLAWHLSGGTCELLLCEKEKIEIIGGTKDISFGQLIDRIGVAMGLIFPCGKQLDKLAEGRRKGHRTVRKIPIQELFFNVSGIESQLQRMLTDLSSSEAVEKEYEAIASLIFYHIAKCLHSVSAEAKVKTGISSLLFTGGVAASGYLRASLLPSLSAEGITCFFGEAALSSDNACGTALIGGDALWP